MDFASAVAEMKESDQENSDASSNTADGSGLESDDNDEEQVEGGEDDEEEEPKEGEEDDEDEKEDSKEIDDSADEVQEFYEGPDDLSDPNRRRTAKYSELRCTLGALEGKHHT